MAQHIALLIITVICLGLAVAGNVASLTGYSWWKVGKTENGLWRTCTKHPQGDWKCDIFKNPLSFDKAHLDKTIVILLLIISSGLLFLSLILSLTMCYCLDRKCAWLCGSVILCIKTFLGGGAGFASLIYAEVVLKDDFKKYDRGWSNIVGWVGSSIGIVTFLLSVAMCCVKPKTPEDAKYPIHASTYGAAPFTGSAAFNGSPPYNGTAGHHPPGQPNDGVQYINRGYQV